MADVVDKVIEYLRKARHDDPQNLSHYISEEDIEELCEIGRQQYLSVENVISLSSKQHQNILVVGDIHGQYYDMLQMFDKGDRVSPNSCWVFLGDYVDRGYNSIETFVLLLALKIKFPTSYYLLRGNHETRNVNQVYGFYEESISKYESVNVWKMCNELFDCLPLAVIIDDQYFCVHGGLSKTVTTIDQMRALDRYLEVPQDGAISDLLWSDPVDKELASEWQVSARGAGYLFGHRETKRFLEKNKLKQIFRSHQLVQEGVQGVCQNRIITIWSAPNYMYRCNNMAGFLHIHPELSRQSRLKPKEMFVEFPKAAAQHRGPCSTKAEYFL